MNRLNRCTFFHRCSGYAGKTVVAVFLASLPLIAQPQSADTSSCQSIRTPLQSMLIKEAVAGMHYPYPSYQQREEDLFFSKNYYALARHPQQGYKTFDLFDREGKKLCSVGLDQRFTDASLSDISWFIINRAIDPGKSNRTCIVYDQLCHKMIEMQFIGKSMIISPSGDYGTVSGPDPVTGKGNFGVYCFRKISKSPIVPLENAQFLGARFCSDNALVVLWKEKRDSSCILRIMKYDVASGLLLKSAIVENEKGSSLTCPPFELLQFAESPNHDLFGFFAIDDRYCLTAQQGVPNTTVVFDANFKIKAFSSDRIHRSLKIINHTLFAVSTWFNPSLFSQSVKIPDNNDEKLELIDFTMESAVGETEGVTSPLVSAVDIGDEICCVFEVDFACVSFIRTSQKFSRFPKENSNGVPIAMIGQKPIRYSFPNKKFIGP